MTDNEFTEKESLRLITEMIGKAKGSFHEDGSSSILWGCVIAVCGLASFAGLQWNFSIGFDVWLLALAAVVPQIYISIREARRRKVLTHNEVVLNHIWMVYGISIFALVFYFNIVPGVTDRLLLSGGTVLTQRDVLSGIEKPFHYFVASSGSLLLLLYAIPTLVTGLTYRFKPMLAGAAFCYLFFALSLFTETKWDMLFNGLAAIGNWLIPGLLLRKRFHAEKAADV